MGKEFLFQQWSCTQIMQVFTFALRSFRRDWRSAELRILAIALVIAVASVTAVSFFTNRINRLMEQQATEMLGADIVLSAAEPLPTAWIDDAHNRTLHTATTVSFASVVLHDEKTKLSAVKAVSDNYPLRGQLQISEKLYEPAIATQSIPSSGTVWIEPHLLTELGLQVGDTLKLGEATLIVSKILEHEPDRGGQFFQFAPRLLMNLTDVESTQLISVGSRARYRLLVAGAEDKISDYRAWLEKQLQPGQEIQDVRNARPEMRMALERVEQFLGLVALIAVIVTGAAVAVAARHFSEKQADTSAIMRCLGATESLILQVYVLRILALGLLASMVGCLGGWIAQSGLTLLLANYLVTGPLPAPSFASVWVGLATGLITLLGFALPPVLRIHAVPPLRVLRHDINATPASVWQVLGVASIAMAGLMFWQAGDTKLALWSIAGILLTLLILMATAYGLVYSLRPFRHKAGVTWRFGFANLARRAQSSSIQLTAFGLSIMALLLLAVVRVDLLHNWQLSLPENTPNRFIINIQPTAVQAIQDKLTQHNFHSSGLYPMVVGRFVAINDRPVSADNYSSDRAKQLINRTFNLSSAEQLATDNEVIAGTFDHAHLLQQLSVEEGFAKELGIRLGDKLHFHVGGQDVIAHVTSLRSVRWDSFNVNFFVVASPDMIKQLPATYVTSFYLPRNSTYNHFEADLVRDFPSISVIDTETLISQVRQMIDQASLAIQYIFIFTVLAGFVVLYAAISASHEERLYEGAILRTLGATRLQVWSGLLAEFVTLGTLAGVLAATAASLIGWVLSEQIFHFPYHFNLWLWIIGTMGGGIGVGLAGVWGTRAVLQRPPLRTLQRI